MALPTNHPFNEITLQAAAVSVASGQAAYIRAPCRGLVRRVGTVIGGAVTTADATVTTSIGATAITGGAFVITQSASAAGDEDFADVNNGGNATITAANQANEGDLIKFAFTGSGTAGGAVTCYATIRPN
jgi:hypothetical protein